MNNGAVLFLFYALLAATLDNLGQGFQKGGIAWLEKGAVKALWQGREWPAFRHWMTGVAMSIAYPFVLALALGYGPVNLTAALGVFGLIPLYLYASKVLKERITGYHSAGLFAILISTLWVGYKSLSASLPESQFSGDTLGLVLIVSLGSSGLWSAVALWHRSIYLGFALGTLAGVLGGLNLLLLKWGALFKAWWTAGSLWLALSIVCFAVLQFAYMRSNALQIVSANTAVGFLFPILVAPLLFGEPFPMWLLFGMLGSCFAVYLLTRGERAAHRELETSEAPPASPAS